jgi:hypothetical protein
VHRFPIYNYNRYSELPFGEFDIQKFAIYIVDKEWNYLFANKFVFDLHMLDRTDLIGNNVWEILQGQMQLDSQFKQFINTIKSGASSSVVTLSPMSNKRVSVIGYPLQDCFYFAVTILPDEQELRLTRKKEINS